MEFLGLIYAISGVLALLLVLSTTRAAVEYRAIGVRRRDVLRGAGIVLVLASVWSLAAVGLLGLAPWAHGAPFSLPWPHVLLAMLPVVMGWLPGAVLLVLGAGETSGTLDDVPRWARWMDALWTA